MRYLVLLIIPIVTFAIVNPYKNVSNSEKINLLVNYFINEDLKKLIPPKPIKGKIKDNSPINPVKYEQYFSYIQRIKAITDERTAEQNKIDMKYKGVVGFYNGKLNSLKDKYQSSKELNKIVQNSFNKTFKILFGKPKIKDLYFDKNISKIVATLWVDDIYGYDVWVKQSIVIDIPKDTQSIFLETYKTSKVFIQFDYDNNLLKLKDIMILFQKKRYNANFKDIIKQDIQLDIQVNNDIYKPVEFDKSKK